MGVAELLERVEYLVDPSGKKKAVVVDYAVWEQLLTLLEELEDAEEIRRLREAGEEAIPWAEAKAELRAEGLNVQPPILRRAITDLGRRESSSSCQLEEWQTCGDSGSIGRG